MTTHFDEETSVAEWMGGGFGWGTYVASSRTDVFGRLSYLDLGNTYGTVVSYGYEVGTDRLMNVKLDRERIGGTELDIRYAYDDAGNVLSAKDKPTAAGRAADQQCYQYDALRHLTEAWTPATGNCALTRSPAALGGSAPYWASFKYDDVLGNRTDETYRTRGLGGDVDGGVTTQRGYDYEGSRDLNADGDSTDAGEFAGPHAVTAITTDGPSGSTGTSFTYDNAGRTRTQDSDYLTSKLSLGWDHESELASTSTATTVYPEPEPGSGDDDSDGDQSSGTEPDRGTGTTTTVTGRNLYTADGDRLVRTAPDGTITVYLGGQEITKAANGTVTGARYYSFAGQTVAMRTANGLGGVTSLINNAQGTPLASVHNTNWTTTSVAKYYTLPFGEQRGGGSAPGDHEFLGKVRDDATGLTLVGARWYDETVGRFLSVDPIMDLADPQQWNAYAYANNNPITYSDPTGLWWEALPVSNMVMSSGTVASAGTSNGIAGGPSCRYASCDGTDKGGEFEHLYFQHGAGFRLAEAVKAERNAQYWASITPEGRALHDAIAAAQAEVLPDQAHTLLDLLGLVPVVGEPADLLNCGAYGLEGDGVNAGLSCGGAVPVLGWAATAAKGTIRAADAAGAAGKSADEVGEAVGATCQRNSFDAGTLVLMADGSHKSIEDIELGDEVIATDPETGEQGPRKVIDLIRHAGLHTMVDIELSDGSQVDATDEHPFWVVSEAGWVGATDLEAGDTVTTAGGATLTVESTTVSQIDLTAYNLTIAELHTYHVTVSDVLVHNCPADENTSHGEFRKQTRGVDVDDVWANGDLLIQQEDGLLVRVLSQGNGVNHVVIKNGDGKVVTALDNLTDKQLQARLDDERWMEGW